MLIWYLISIVNLQKNKLFAKFETEINIIYKLKKTKKLIKISKIAIIESYSISRFDCSLFNVF